MIHTRMKERFQVTLNPTLVAQARRDMTKRGFDSLSEYLEHLIRDAWESHTAAAGAALHDGPVTYRKPKKKP